MKNKINGLLDDIHNFNADTKDEIETFRIKFLGSKGLLKQLFADFKNIEASQKKEIGQALNNLRTLATEKVNTLNNALEDSTDSNKNIYGDLTRPAEPLELGARHPISIVK
ncbi:MAG: phenylalanine--tRNA ligase subunit alpha, partial [Flavobacteriaceae bacterium]|nr:phenylalanine--tRNA ligase subunit alpha [Flavobacteriaceae bacterium]